MSVLQNCTVTSTTGTGNDHEDGSFRSRRSSMFANFWPNVSTVIDSGTRTNTESSSSSSSVASSEDDGSNSYSQTELDISRIGSAVSQPIPVPMETTAGDRPIRPPFHNQNYQEARYKTELCLHYRDSNTCIHGANCLFAHGLEELRPYRGRHPKHKTQLCKAFHEQGFCNYGYRCSYIHSESPRTIRYIRELNDRARRARHRQHQRRSNGSAQRFHANRNLDISLGSGGGNGRTAHHANHRHRHQSPLSLSSSANRRIRRSRLSSVTLGANGTLISSTS